MLKVENVSGGYGEEEIVKNISFSVTEGEFFGILGPNGSGKTTLIKMISGLLGFQKGSVKINGKSITDYSKKELAKSIAVLPQLSPQVFPYTVKEMVSLGRYAHHSGLFQRWTKQDEAIVQQVMRQTNIHEFKDTSVMEHSGGEQQRIFLAQALVQQPQILLLDEPTNHLDLAYQKELLDLLSKRAKEEGLTVIAILHDLNLASLYCDRLLLMEEGKARAIDKPDAVLAEELINNVYRTEVIKQPHSKIAKPQLHLVPDQRSEYDDTSVIINESHLSLSPDSIVLESAVPLKTVSSGVVGAGIGWYKSFVNRHVEETYHCVDHRKEMRNYLAEKGFHSTQTVGMMTAVEMEDYSCGFYQGKGFSILVVVTAGVGAAVDGTRTKPSLEPAGIGTINTWVFINGVLTQEAFIQSIITATEAKAQVLRDLDIKDAKTNTFATGTPTDSILIAATQQGKELEYAGTATELGTLIGGAVYREMKQAISNYLKRKNEHD